MVNKYRINKNELMEHWEDQIDVLKRTTKLFDEGNEKEARRIAACLRIMFHQTNRSNSLFKQLSLPLIFISSGGLYTPSNLLSSWVLLSLKIDGEGLGYSPTLEKEFYTERTFFMNFEDWWNEIIFDDKQSVFTRRDIVWFVANQDGGAHIDPNLSESYASLTKMNSLGWVDGEGNPPSNNPAYQSIRVIADEVLHSIINCKSGFKNRKKSKGREIEMRFVDKNRRFKWSTTEMTYSDETFEIVKQCKKKSRKLHIQEFGNGRKVEYIG